MDYIFVNYATTNWNARYVFLLRTQVMFTYLQFHMRIYLRVCKYIMVLYAYSDLEIYTVVNRLIKFPGFITNYANIKWHCECVDADVSAPRNYRLARFCKLWLLLGTLSFFPLLTERDLEDGNFSFVLISLLCRKWLLTLHSLNTELYSITVHALPLSRNLQFVNG